MAVILVLIWVMFEGGMFFISCRVRYLERDGWLDGCLCSFRFFLFLVLVFRIYGNDFLCFFF